VNYVGDCKLKSGRSEGVLSLLYVAGERPSADDVERLLAGPANEAGLAAQVSFSPDRDEGWLELLASGLTFDISGLSPAPAMPAMPGSHFFGLPLETRDSALEAVTLSAGEHIALGATMLPIIRVMCRLGAGMTSLGNVKAVCWHPAQSWIEPAYFTRAISNWLAGGVFPALGLTALQQLADGSVESMGLSFFAGQEVRIDRRTGEGNGDTARLAIRVIDLMVRQGAFHEDTSLAGPDGEVLLIERLRDGMVVVHRSE